MPLRDAPWAATVCPFCQATDEKPCMHFVGWTDDGRTINEWRVMPGIAHGPKNISSDDRIVTTGVSARVYRP